MSERISFLRPASSELFRSFRSISYSLRKFLNRYYNVIECSFSGWITFYLLFSISLIKKRNGKVELIYVAPQIYRWFFGSVYQQNWSCQINLCITLYPWPITCLLLLTMHAPTCVYGLLLSFENANAIKCSSLDLDSESEQWSESESWQR